MMLFVREMSLDEIDIRIGYFHRSSDEDLRRMGVDRELLPEPTAWRAQYTEDYARPTAERASYTLIWEIDREIVGFGSVDRIEVGEQAFMHLHVLDPTNRRRGIGAEFVRLSTLHYFDRFDLQRLYCEPNALNLAPNRTLQRVGFRYVDSHESAPTPINFLQIVTRWVMDRPTD